MDETLPHFALGKRANLRDAKRLKGESVEQLNR
jgi:hypothetical protein